LINPPQHLETAQGKPQATSTNLICGTTMDGD
jgi:hypothetical protein